MDLSSRNAPIPSGSVGGPGMLLPNDYAARASAASASQGLVGAAIPSSDMVLSTASSLEATTIDQGPSIPTDTIAFNGIDVDVRTAAYCKIDQQIITLDANLPTGSVLFDFPYGLENLNNHAKFWVTAHQRFLGPIDWNFLFSCSQALNGTAVIGFIPYGKEATIANMQVNKKCVTVNFAANSNHHYTLKPNASKDGKVVSYIPTSYTDEDIAGQRIVCIVQVPLTNPYGVTGSTCSIVCSNWLNTDFVALDPQSLTSSDPSPSLTTPLLKNEWFSNIPIAQLIGSDGTLQFDGYSVNNAFRSTNSGGEGLISFTNTRNVSVVPDTSVIEFGESRCWIHLPEVTNRIALACFSVDDSSVKGAGLVPRSDINPEIEVKYVDGGTYSSMSMKTYPDNISTYKYVSVGGTAPPLSVRLSGDQVEEYSLYDSSVDDGLLFYYMDQTPLAARYASQHVSASQWNNLFLADFRSTAAAGKGALGVGRSSGSNLILDTINPVGAVTNVPENWTCVCITDQEPVLLTPTATILGGRRTVPPTQGESQFNKFLDVYARGNRIQFDITSVYNSAPVVTCRYDPQLNVLVAGTRDRSDAYSYFNGGSLASLFITNLRRIEPNEVLPVTTPANMVSRFISASSPTVSITKDRFRHESLLVNMLSGASTGAANSLGSKKEYERTMKLQNDQQEFQKEIQAAQYDQENHAARKQYRYNRGLANQGYEFDTSLASQQGDISSELSTQAYNQNSAMSKQAYDQNVAMAKTQAGLDSEGLSATGNTTAYIDGVNEDTPSEYETAPSQSASYHSAHSDSTMHTAKSSDSMHSANSGTGSFKSAGSGGNSSFHSAGSSNDSFGSAHSSDSFGSARSGSVNETMNPSGPMPRQPAHGFGGSNVKRGSKSAGKSAAKSTMRKDALMMMV